MSLKVLFVDDEIPAIETLKCIVNWEKLGYTIVGAANNGRDALRMFIATRPDLVITDIQMPIMDGLELIRNIKKINRDQKFILLSCHENFYYAREAMKLGVSDYLLKDLLTANELEWLLSEFNNSTIDKSNTFNTSAFEYNMQRYHNAAACFSAIMNTDSASSPEKHSMLIEQYRLNLSNNASFVSIHVKIDDAARVFGDNDGFTQELIDQISALINTGLDAAWGGEVISAGRDGISAVACIETSSSQLKMLTDCHSVCLAVRKSLTALNELSVTIGVSNPFSELSMIRSKIKEAITAANTRIFYGKGKNLLYNTITASMHTSLPNFDAQLAEISRSVKEANVENISAVLKNLYQPKITGLPQFNYLKELNSALIRIIIEAAVQQNVSYVDIFGENRIPLEKLEELETAQEAADWFTRSFLKLTRTEKVVPAYSKRVAEAIKYIQTRYNSDIGLEAVAEALDVHKGYLCRIFKRETGQTITDYITALRIKEAQRLISTTSMKLYEISEIVGFTTPQQFSLVFKKVTGMNPAKYKN